MAYTTDRSIYHLSTPLGKDVLLIRNLRGFEGVSRLFEFQLDLLSERDDILPDEIIGKRVTLNIETDIGERYFTGLVANFSRGGTYNDPGADNNELTEYQCIVVPWMWPLTLHEESRVFQNMSIPDIVEKILGEFELRDYELDFADSYPELEYCTQYGETNYAFITRLLEQAGIHYYVKYSGEVEKIVFSDHNDAHPPLENDEIRFSESRATEDLDNISALTKRNLLRTGRVMMRDHNFETPDDTLETSIDSLIQLGDNSNYFRYVYPGNYRTTEEGDTVARLQMEAEEAEHEILDGEGTVRALVPGHWFKLHSHPIDAMNRKYIVLGIWHEGSNAIARGSGSSYYQNRFTVIPHDVDYRPRQTTPKPVVYGPQTAVVTGPSGEEIHTDEYGRVKLQFFWDREGVGDEKSSCWVRVVMPHAGARWGIFMLPRIGEEVLVAFEHGDPDRPIVVGSVYNANNMPPYPLPENATRSTMKSSSSKGGAGFNELRFEDKAGEEEVFLHAQKDFQERIGHDSFTTVVNERQLTVGKDSIQSIGENLHLDVSKNSTINVGSAYALNVGQGLALATGQEFHLSSGMDTSVEGGTTVNLKAGTNLVLEAGMTVSLKAGPSSITLGMAGVKIDGPMVQVNCGGSPLSASKPQKPDKPKAAKEAIKDKAGKFSDPLQQTQAKALRKAAQKALPFCKECAEAKKKLRAMKKKA